MPRYKVTGPEALNKKKRAAEDRSVSSQAKKAKVQISKPPVNTKQAALALANQIKQQKHHDPGRPKVQPLATKAVKLKPATLEFLRGIKDNNTREWFAENKAEYESAKTDFERLVEVIVPMLGGIDPALRVLQAKSCIFRIFRDVRFSGGASDPYKTYMSAFFGKSGKSGQHAGYYLHIEPGGLSIVGGGMWTPSKDVIATMRSNIAADPARLRAVLSSPTMKKQFGANALDDDDKHILKTAPKGFSRDHEAIDLLRYKSYIVNRRLSDDELTRDGLAKIIAEVYEAMAPFIQLLNEYAGLP